MTALKTSVSGMSKVIQGKVIMVALDVLDQLWPKVVPILMKEKTWWEAYYEIEDLLAHIRSGNLQLWIGVEDKEIFIVCLTEIAKFPKCRILRYVFLAGRGIKPLRPSVIEINQWGAMHGCTRSEIFGRDAWIKLMAPFGYKKKSVIVEHIFDIHLGSNRSN